MDMRRIPDRQRFLALILGVAQLRAWAWTEAVFRSTCPSGDGSGSNPKRRVF